MGLGAWRAARQHALRVGGHAARAERVEQRGSACRVRWASRGHEGVEQDASALQLVVTDAHGEQIATHAAQHARHAAHAIGGATSSRAATSTCLPPALAAFCRLGPGVRGSHLEVGQGVEKKRLAKSV